MLQHCECMYGCVFLCVVQKAVKCLSNVSELSALALTIQQLQVEPIAKYEIYALGGAHKTNKHMHA